MADVYNSATSWVQKYLRDRGDDMVPRVWDSFLGMRIAGGCHFVVDNEVAEGKRMTYLVSRLLYEHVNFPLVTQAPEIALN